MNPVTCIAIDDEPLALSLITQYCRRRGGLRLLTFSEPQRGLDAINATKPDIVFLDIEMTEISGLDIARQLPATTGCIFTTAYTRYAIDGFELNVIDYLHKPFTYERFCKALDRAADRLERHRTVSQERTINVKSEYESVCIPLSDILYIEAVSSYIKIVRASGQRTLTRMTLKEMEKLLPVHDFIRIHRSFIVAKNKVAGFTKTKIILTNKVELPVGRLNAGALAELGG